MQGVDGRGELVALAGDVGLERSGVVPLTWCAFIEWPPLTVATSSLTFSMVRSGAGGVACSTSFLPSTAAARGDGEQDDRPRSGRRPTPVAASASARIAVAIRVARPKNASSPAALNMPIPSPAFLPFWVSSAWASRISLRTSSGICSDSRWTRAPMGSSAVRVVWSFMSFPCPTGSCANVARR